MSQMDLLAGAVELQPYSVPTMAEVRETEWNGLTCIGSFSGCGGSSMGMRYAGWRVPVAVEFIPEAARTYRANSSATVFEKDVRALSGEDLLLEAGLDVGELDCFEGSPPCSSFSSAGSGQKDWGKTKKYSDGEQRTDDLFFEYVRLIDEMKPRSFVAENVPGLIRGMALGEYANQITRLMSELGYRIDVRVLNAAAFGAATERERLIFLGVRQDLGVNASLPYPSLPRPYTIQEALEYVRDNELEDHPEDVAESWMDSYAVGRTWHAIRESRARGLDEPDTRTLGCEKCGKVPHEHKLLAKDGKQYLISEKPHGIEWEDGWFRGGGVSKGLCADGERAVFVKLYNLLVVPRENEPCPTITATGSQTGAASVTHPTECRKLTPREAAIISGFPSDFVLTGSRQQRYERIGRAVPPPLYAAVGQHLADILREA